MTSRLPAWFRVAAAMFAVGWGANQFAAMLLVYRGEDDFSTEAVTGLFGAYALGLIPALLIVGPISDRVGRRRVMRPVLVLSVVATVVLIVGGHSLAVLLVGRLLAGIASGAAFAPGSAWIKELSADRPSGTGARRAALALSAGFGSGPLVAGVLAEWLPAPTVLPYVPHLVLMVYVVAIAWSAPEPVSAPPDRDRHGHEIWSVVRSRPFLLGILLTAPWVFGAASTSFVTIPTFVTISQAPIAVTGTLCGLTLWTGALVQPFGKRLGDARLIIAAGLLAAVAGLLMGVVVARTDHELLLPVVAVLLGTAYGLVLVGGLTTIEQIAHRDDLATLNAIFYSLTYLGFASPLLSALALRTLSPTGLLSVGAVVALLTIPLGLASRVTRRA